MKKANKISFMPRAAIAIISMVILIQTGSPRSGEGKERPSVNITGTLIDSNGNKSTLEYITIAGRYSQIPFYQEPTNPEEDPSTNTTKVDLEEVDQIIKNNPTIVQFRKRDYIRLSITFKGNIRTKGDYIIERNRHIRAQEAGMLERELSFTAIDKLIIHDVKQGGCTAKTAPYSSSAPSDLDLMITQTKKLLEEIEKTAEQLPAEPNSPFQGLKSQLLYLIKELKNSIWKLFA